MSLLLAITGEANKRTRADYCTPNPPIKTITGDPSGLKQPQYFREVNKENVYFPFPAFRENVPVQNSTPQKITPVKNRDESRANAPVKRKRPNEKILCISPLKNVARKKIRRC